MILHVAALLIAQAAHQPSSGNVLATPAPAASIDPSYAAHPGADELREGRQLYAVHCASCHGLVLQGSPQAPPLVTVDASNVDFMLQTGRMPAEKPFEQEYDKPPQFSLRQIQAIVSYVMSRSSGDKMLPIVHAGNDLKNGREIWDGNCRQCHGASGHGNNVGYRNVAPSLMDASPLQIAEAVREGPDVMPRFGPKTVSDANLDDLIAYIRYLQTAQYNPGGLQLANLGPIAEGFIGWTFGIGLLVLLVRRIGETE